MQDAGRVTAEIAKAHAESEFEKYRIVQDRLFESDFDRLLKQPEHKGSQKNKLYFLGVEMLDWVTL